VGKRKHVAYRVVVCDQRTQRDGAFIENLGSYEPHADPPIATLNEESAREWLSKGASPSEAVEKIFRRIGVIEGGSLERTQIAPKPKADAEEAAAEAPAEEATAEAPAEEVVAEAPAEEPEATTEEAAPEKETPAEKPEDADTSTEEE